MLLATSWYLVVLPRLRRCVRWSAVLALLVACGGTIWTPLPPGMHTLEANTAPWPQSKTDPYPESLAIVTGWKQAYDWGHARAYIHASPAAVWRAFQDPEVVADRHGTDAHSVQLNAEPAYPFSFRIHYEESIVDRYENWRFGESDWLEDQPQLALVRYQKTEGTSFIHLLEGSIIVGAVDGHADVAVVELIFHLSAANSGVEQVLKTLNNQYSSVLAKVRGKPLP